jgi:Transcription factor/nuclear export subunit protein 2
LDAKKVEEFLSIKLRECFETIEEENLVNFATLFIQYCIYPRLMFSAADALYSINFLKTMVSHRVPNFNILHTIGLTLKNIVPSIHCCTNAESDNLAIFFQELYTQINEWTKPDVWDRECEGYSGFSNVITGDGSHKSITFMEFQKIAKQI